MNADSIAIPLPKSEETERHLLSVCIQYPDECLVAALREGVQGSWFLDASLGRMFDDLAQRFRAGEAKGGFNNAHLTDDYDRSGLLDDLGGRPGLMQIWTAESTSEWGKTHIERVREAYTKRKFVSLADGLRANAYSTTNSTALYSELESGLLQLQGHCCPKVGAAAAWGVCDGADAWTDDPTEIHAMADAPIIDGMLRERELMQVVGGSKTLKTWATLHLAVAVATGGEFLGRATERRRVLYIDYELKRSTFRRRLSMVSPTKPEGFDFICLRGKQRLPSPDDLKQLVESEGYGVVVIDSLYRTGWQSEENSNDDVSRELTPLQWLTDETGTSLVIVDHTAKGAGEGKRAVDSSRGASAKGGFMDSILLLRPAESVEDGEMRAVLDPVFRDWPAFDRLPVIGYRFTDTRCEMSIVSEADQNDVNGKRAVIFEAVANAGKEGISAADLAAEIGGSRSTIDRYLRELCAGENAQVVKFPDPKHKQRVR